MLRRDGTWTIYLVERLVDLHGHGEDWHPTGDYEISKVPVDIRFTNPDKYDGKQNEPFHSFSASGMCWQDTGIHGTYRRAVGIQMLSLLQQYLPTHKFRLVSVTVSQKRTVVMEGQG